MTNIGPSPVGPANLAVPLNVSNQGMPANGKISAVPVTLNFGATQSYSLDFTNAQWQGKITAIQSVFVDNSGSGAAGPLSIYCPISGQSVTVPARAQAYLPLIIPTPPQLIVTNPSGSATTLLTFLNVPMPAAVWFPTTTAESFDASGNLLTNDQAVQQIIGGAPVTVASPTTLISRSTTTVNPAASTTLMSANTSRKYLLIQAPASADMWINLIGGTAGASLTNCIKVPAGAFYESAICASNTAITYYTTATSAVLTAFEG
jgi:hypothetical protein